MPKESSDATAEARPESAGDPPGAKARTAAVEEAAHQVVTTPQQRQRAFLLLFASLMCLGMGQSIVFTVLPGAARSHLGLSEFQTGMIFSLSSIAWVITAPFWGRRSDIWGRKPVILIGMSGFAVSILFFGLSEGAGIINLLPVGVVYAALILSRTIYGVLGPGAHAGSQAYIIDRTSRAKRTEAIASLTAAWGTGTVLGPGLGAMLIVFGLIAPFLFLAVFAFACVIGIYFLLPERTPPKSRDWPKMRLTDRRVVVFVIFGTVAAMVQAIPTQTIAFYMTDMLKLKPADAIQLVGIGLMAFAMAGLIAQLVLVQRFRLTARQLTLFGLVLCFVSAILIVVSRQYAAMVFALVLNGLGFGMCRPGITASASLSVKRSEQGGVAGAMVGTGGAGFVLCSLIAVPLYPVSHQAPYLLAAALLAMLLIAYFVLPDFKRDLTAIPEEPETDVSVAG